MNKKQELTWGLIVKELIDAILIDLISALVVMVMWNWVGVDVLQLPNIGYGQAFGLLCLSCILFTRYDVRAKLKD